MSFSVVQGILARFAKAFAVADLELGVFHPRHEQMRLRAVPRSDLVHHTELIRWLRLENRNGGHIYVRPAGTHPLTLLDDLDKDAVRTMFKAGWEPALVIETSPRNFQVWLNHGQVLEPAPSTRAAKVLADRWGGDPSSADWRHFGRLPGFTNPKKRYLSPDGRAPFVRLRANSGAVYPQATDFLVELAQGEVDTARNPLPPPRPRPVSVHDRSLKSIADFRDDPRFDGDLHRADLAYVVYALRHGVTMDTIRADLADRDLSHKGGSKRQTEYIERTLEKGLRSLS